MIRKIVIGVLLLSTWAFRTYAQKTETRLFKIEAFVDKLALGYELPFTQVVLLDVTGGICGTLDVTGDGRFQLLLLEVQSLCARRTPVLRQ